MNFKRHIGVLFILFWAHLSFAQDKLLQAEFADSKINIDGIVDEAVWQKAEATGNFVTYSPTVNQKPRFDTRVKVLYDNKALYISAILYDTSPDSLCTELTVRDNDNGNTDMFIVTLNPNNDGQNAYDFKVSASNVQTDVRISTNYWDYSWDAVWESAVKINDDNWTLELRIPYSAIRFPNLPEQTWSVNFWRVDRRVREASSWNLVDKTKGEKTEQMGQITGINNIRPPLRLSFTPYVAGYLNHYSGNEKPSYAFNGGLDMKLGLSASHTLDMTLVPDFGQDKSDYEELNLSPYETYYEENRPFFTEGTDLFTKCGLFYSRRIGKIPSGYNDIDSLNDYGYQITNKPRYSKLINAFKITGRDKNNLGIGVFNAITANTYAKAINPNGEEERFLIEPYANYNMLVLDQAFKKHSFVNLTNASVIRPGNKYVSNVLGSSIKLMEKTNRFGLETSGAWSHIKDSAASNSPDGYSLSAKAGKLNGTWSYYYNINVESDTYNPNEMGYLMRNNKINHTLQLKYRIFEPFWKLNQFQQRVDIAYNTLYENTQYTGAYIFLWTYGLTRSYVSFWNNLTIDLGETYDFFEPRTEGRFLTRPASYFESLYLSTDYRKTFAIDITFHKYGDTDTQDSYFLRISPRVRVNDRLTLRYRSEFNFNRGDRGFVESINTDSVIMGIRDVNTFTNSVSVNYVISNKMYISFDARHYWSKVNYTSYHELLPDGYLGPEIDNYENANINFNAFNIDLLFSWNFAPGSFLSLVYKNQIYASNDFVELQTFPKPGENLKNTFQSPQNNSLSLKLLYYLDWQYLQN